MTDPLAERFRAQGEACGRTGSTLYADLCARLAGEPLVREIAPDERWDFPVRLLGGLHHLVLSGRAPGWAWEDVRETLQREAGWLTRFTRKQPVQTNEVQRSWALLPAFLSLGEGPFELIELGSSAGLNLVWDRYRYRYAAGTWGATGAALELAGDERAPVPAELLSVRPQIRHRRGVDLAPVDVASDESVRLLECFVWADQPARLERLRRAVEVVRGDPPPILQGDYVELLPDLLADRDYETVTVVFQAVSTVYLGGERYGELRRIVDEADPPVAWISTRRLAEEETGVEGGFEIERRLPGEAAPRLVACMGYHGQWLEWRGA
ncbi:MAG: DUF2332 domain-containing protein [Gaiellaceae bacterium]